jgi:F-box protein 11
MAGDVFISYSRSDQVYVDRLVTLLRGRGATVWFDDQVDPGSRWAAVIEAKIRDCTAMLVVMTPASEASGWVQREINEAEHWAKPIFPLLLEGDRVWFRLSDYQSEIVRTGSMPSEGFVDAVVTGAPSAPRRPPRRATSVPTVVVDATGRGDYDDLAIAARSVVAGTRLVIRPGRYTGGLKVDNRLEIVGDGHCAEIVVEASGRDVVLWTARAGRLENLTIRQLGGGPWDGVKVAAGAVNIVGCDISAVGQYGVAVHAGTANVTACRVHQCRKFGLALYENAQGLIENNDITNNGAAGIRVNTAGDPTVRANRITANADAGVYIYAGGLGTFENNDITNNKSAGVLVEMDGDPRVQANRIKGNAYSGVHVRNAARGTFENNDITENKGAGIAVADPDSEPIVRANRITGNAYSGVYVSNAARGTFEDNDITDNGKSKMSFGVAVRSAAPVIRRNRLSENGRPGIYVSGGDGRYEYNEGGNVVTG